MLWMIGNIIEKVEYYRTRLLSSRRSGDYYGLYYTGGECPLNNAPYNPAFEIEGDITVIDMSFIKYIPKKYREVYNYEILGVPVDLPVKINSEVENAKLLLIEGNCKFIGATQDLWHRIDKIVIAGKYTAPYHRRKELVEMFKQEFIQKDKAKIGNLEVIYGDLPYNLEEIEKIFTEKFGDRRYGYKRKNISLFNHVVFFDDYAYVVRCDNTIIAPYIKGDVIIKSVHHPFYKIASTWIYALQLYHPNIQDD